MVHNKSRKRIFGHGNERDRDDWVANATGGKGGPVHCRTGVRAVVEGAAGLADRLRFLGDCGNILFVSSEMGILTVRSDVLDEEIELWRVEQS